MHAAVLQGIGRMSIEDVPQPECAPGGMVLRVRACAICGTDVRIFRHGKRNVRPPCIVGHEITGEIVEIGADVTGYTVGEPVLLIPGIPCGRCRYCLQGRTSLCTHGHAIGYEYPGGFAEYIAVPPEGVRAGSVIKLPSLSFAHAAITEPLACALSAHERTQTGLGDTVVIFGAGPIGAMHILLAKLRGAARVVTIDLLPARLAQAHRFAPDLLINGATEDVVATVMEYTDGYGADVVITAASSRAAQEQAIALAGPRARIVFFGGLPPDNGAITFDSNRVHYGEMAVFGLFGSNLAQNHLALQLIASGQIPADQLVTHVLPLNEIEEGIALIERGEALRVVIKP